MQHRDWSRMGMLAAVKGGTEDLLGYRACVLQICRYREIIPLQSSCAQGMVVYVSPVLLVQTTSRLSLRANEIFSITSELSRPSMNCVFTSDAHF